MIEYLAILKRIHTMQVILSWAPGYYKMIHIQMSIVIEYFKFGPLNKFSNKMPR